ncbi:MAG: M28 family peptidase [Ignavibacteriales bacterium]|nr:M28 family peptidase [Ignavibacteriales bacterium]
MENLFLIDSIFSMAMNDEPTIYSYADVKHRVAISRGAAGTIIIPQININDGESWQKLINEYSFEDIKLSYNASDSFGIILNPEIARKLFVRENKNSTMTISPEEINTNDILLRFEGEFFVRDFKSHNVIGMIPGNSIDKEYLIISAHYDHLGIGPSINGDKIYNGVLDNAIGVAALLEVARELKKKKNF